MNLEAICSRNMDSETVFARRKYWLKCWARGMSFAEIGRKTGYSRAAVHIGVKEEAMKTNADPQTAQRILSVMDGVREYTRDDLKHRMKAKGWSYSIDHIGANLVAMVYSGSLLSDRVQGRATYRRKA